MIKPGAPIDYSIHNQSLIGETVINYATLQTNQRYPMWKQKLIARTPEEKSMWMSKRIRHFTKVLVQVKKKQPSVPCNICKLQHNNHKTCQAIENLDKMILNEIEME